MPMNNTSYNVAELYVGKGIVTLKPEGETTWFDVGTVPEFEFTPNVEELEHFSPRSGVRTRDLTIVLERGGDLRVMMEEWTSFNMQIILLGDEVVTPGPGTPADDIYEIEILSKTQYSAGVRFQGMNDQGPRWNFHFHKVDFIPSGSLQPISEEWASMEVTGRLAAVDFAGDLKFGYARRLYNGTNPGWSLVGA